MIAPAAYGVSPPAPRFIVTYQNEGGSMIIPSSDVGTAMSVLTNAVRNGATCGEIWVDGPAPRQLIASFNRAGIA